MSRLHIYPLARCMLITEVEIIDDPQKELLNREMAS